MTPEFGHLGTLGNFGNTGRQTDVSLCPSFSFLVFR
jgi:hypothetical protein